MSQIKVVSFDFWNTIGIPSKAYAEAREAELKVHGITKDQYTDCKLFLDNTSLNYNKAWTAAECWQMLSKNEFGKVESQGMAFRMGELFLQYPPKVTSYQLATAFDILEAKGIKSVITSNTNFISGRFIEQVLKDYDLDRYLVRKNFSDLTGIAKPDKKMFIASIYGMGVAPEEVVHIGDSIIFDQEGAERAGMKNFLVGKENPHLDILNYVKGL